MTKIIFQLIVILIFGNRIDAQWNVLQADQFPQLGLGVKNISSPKFNVIWASTFDTSGVNYSNYLYRSIDGGINWATIGINTTGGMKDITSITSINKDTAWAAMNKHGVGSSTPFYYSIILKTMDGGITWNIQPTASFTGPNNHVNFIHFSDANNGICVGDSNTGYWEIYKTVNGGVNWNRINSTNIPSNISNEKGVDNCFDVHNNILWFGTNKGRIYKSLDFGITWSVFSTPLNSISNISMRDSLNGLASSGLSLIKTIDGGITWIPILYNGTFFKNDLTEDPNTLDKYYSCGWENGGWGSSYTIDGGQNWINIDNIPHTTVNFTAYNGWSGGVTYFSTSQPNILFFYEWSQNINTVKSFDNKDYLKIYPNPFTNRVTISSKNSTNIDKDDIFVYNCLGELVKKITVEEYTIEQIELNNIPSGFYIFKIYNKSKLIGSYPMIKE